MDTRNLTFYVDEAVATHTDVTIASGSVGTVNVTNLWAFGPGFHNLRVAGAGLTQSVRFESMPAPGNVLDLRFDDNGPRAAADSSGNNNIGSLSGTLLGNFEGTLDGWGLSCNSPNVAYDRGVIGQGVRMWSTATGAACIYVLLPGAVPVGYTTWFYAKGYVSAGIYNILTSQFVSYVEDVLTGCRTANGDERIYTACNNGNEYTDWRLFKLVVYTSNNNPEIVFYSKQSAFGEVNAGYYDYVTDGPTWTEGRVGKALMFDGARNSVRVPTSSSLAVTNSITIESWVNSASVPPSGVGPEVLRKAGAYDMYHALNAMQSHVKDMREFGLDESNEVLRSVTLDPLTAPSIIHNKNGDYFVEDRCEWRDGGYFTTVGHYGLDGQLLVGGILFDVGKPRGGVRAVHLTFSKNNGSALVRPEFAHVVVGKKVTHPCKRNI